MSTQKHLSARAWAELLSLGVIWGGVFLAVRLAIDEVGILTAVAHRAFWAALLLWLIVATMRLPVPKGLRIWTAFAVMGLLNNIIPYTLLNWSQLYIESGLTAILNGATAIFGVLVAAMLFADERLTWRKGIGITIGFAGMAIVIGPEALQSFDPRSLAQLAALTATLSYAFAGAWARKRLQGLHPLVAAAGMLTCTAFIMVPAAWMLEGSLWVPLRPLTIAALGYYAIIATALAYLLYYRVLEMAGSGNLMLVTLLMPPFAILLGALVLNEALPPRAFIGFAVLALGLLVLDGRAEAWVRNRV